MERARDWCNQRVPAPSTLEHGGRAAFLESLREHAARSRAGHRPRSPGSEAAAEAERFVAAARRVG